MDRFLFILTPLKCQSLAIFEAALLSDDDSDGDDVSGESNDWLTFHDVS